MLFQTCRIIRMRVAFSDQKIDMFDKPWPLFLFLGDLVNLGQVRVRLRFDFKLKKLFKKKECEVQAKGHMTYPFILQKVLRKKLFVALWLAKNYAKGVLRSIRFIFFFTKSIARDHQDAFLWDKKKKKKWNLIKDFWRAKKVVFWNSSIYGWYSDKKKRRAILSFWNKFIFTYALINQ